MAPALGDDPAACHQESNSGCQAGEEARAVGKYVLAHAYSGSAIRNAIQAGVRCIEHGNQLDEVGAQAIKAAGAYLVLTMGRLTTTSRTSSSASGPTHRDISCWKPRASTPSKR